MIRIKKIYREVLSIFVFVLTLLWFAKYCFNTYYSSKLNLKISNSSSKESHSKSEFRNNLEIIDASSEYTLPCVPKKAIRDSISAIKRASSDSCKKKIGELACQSQDVPNGKEKLYPKYIPNFCPTATKQNSKLAGRYLGKKIL